MERSLVLAGLFGRRRRGKIKLYSSFGGRCPLVALVFNISAKQRTFHIEWLLSVYVILPHPLFPKFVYL